MRYKAIIFDLDGTLLNSLEDLADSVNYVLEKHGFAKRTIDEVRRFVGNGIYKLVERALPDTADEDTVQICFEEFSAYYKSNMMNKTKMYDGIDELLTELKKANIKLAVVTNKADFAAQDLCKCLFGNRIDVVVGSNGIRRNKPAPDNILLALEKLNVSKEDTVYIGDSEVDAQTAINSNLDFIAVLWGFRDISDFKGFDLMHTANNISQLKKLLFT